jgi:exopolysaccharide biosynthesis polyprenyl glycosylphosphotransferase
VDEPFAQSAPDDQFAQVTSQVNVPERSWKRRGRALLFFSDLVAVAAAVFVTFHFGPSLQQPLYGAAGFYGVTYGQVAGILIVAWVGLLTFNGSRSSRILGVGTDEYRLVIKSGLWVFGAAAVVSYCFQIQLARSLFLTTLPAGVVLLLVTRWLCRKGLVWLRSKGRAMTPAVIVGDAKDVTRVVGDLLRWPEAGFAPTAVCLTRGDSGGQSLLDDYRNVAFKDIVRWVQAGRVGAVIVCNNVPRHQVRKLSWELEDSPVQLIFQPQLVDVSGPRSKVQAVATLALVHVDLPKYSGWKFALKRVFDIVFSALVLLATWWLWLIIALLIKIFDPGPVFFRQQRIGRGGKPFDVLKFRTMCVDAEEKIAPLIAANGGKALQFKLDDDPRVTGIGRILRKTSLDELPQFWTVLCGDMSVVGPRPQVSREVSEYTEKHFRRLLVKPGITGLWQVNGRSDLPAEEAIRLDLNYVENWSLTGDVVIIVKTVVVVLTGQGAS